MSPTCKTDFKSLKKIKLTFEEYKSTTCVNMGLVIQFKIPFCTEMFSLQIIQVDN